MSRERNAQESAAAPNLMDAHESWQRRARKEALTHPVAEQKFDGAVGRTLTLMAGTFIVGVLVGGCAVAGLRWLLHAVFGG